jgi:prolipoprotein diacylglyceryltransferase
MPRRRLLLGTYIRRQLYESIANALIFGFLYWRVRRTHAFGEVFG